MIFYRLMKFPQLLMRLNAQYEEKIEIIQQYMSEFDVENQDKNDLLKLLMEYKKFSTVFVDVDEQINHFCSKLEFFINKKIDIDIYEMSSDNLIDFFYFLKQKNLFKDENNLKKSFSKKLDEVYSLLIKRSTRIQKHLLAGYEIKISSKHQLFIDKHRSVINEKIDINDIEHLKGVQISNINKIKNRSMKRKLDKELENYYKKPRY